MFYNLDHELTAKTKLKSNQLSFLNWTLIWLGFSHLKLNKILLYVLEKNAIDMNKECLGFREKGLG
jgi:hypothetical protein